MFEDVTFSPLPTSFLVVGLLGFIAVFLYSDRLGVSWSFTLGLFCLILFISSFLSMHYAPLPKHKLEGD